MSDSRWVITPLWLSGSWRSFLYSSVYSCHLFWISSASVRSIPFLSLIVPIFAWNVGISNFLEEISSLSHSIVFLYFLSLITDWCWRWNSNTLATWCEELTHWKRHWCWEKLKAGGEGDNRGWDGWMASLTRRTWVWVSSECWWWTGKPGVLQSMWLQRVGHSWATELNLIFKADLFTWNFWEPSIS